MGRATVVGCATVVMLAGACRHKSEIVAEQFTVRYCATSVRVRDVERCVTEIPLEQQRRRDATIRLTYRDGRLQRSELVSGSGEPHQVDVEDYAYANNQLSRLSYTSFLGQSVGYQSYSPDRQVSHNFDERGRPKRYPNWATSNFRRRFDAAGFVESTALLDVAGNPVASEGVHEWRQKRNAQGVQVESAYFGLKGEAVNSSDGFHRQVRKVDALGLMHSERYFDRENRPALNQGAHEVRVRYDDAGNYTQTDYFAADGSAVRDEQWGAASVRIGRDARGNATEVRLFDERGQPTIGTAGYSWYKVTYDARDRAVEHAYFDANGAPIALKKSGAAITREVYDTRGQLATVRHFDETGARVLNANGAFRFDTERDARGNPITTRYFDVAERPVLTKSGYAIERRTYDGDRFVAYALFDVADKPVLGSNDFTRAELSYDANGAPENWRYFDLDGKELKGTSNGCHGKIDAGLKGEIDARRSAFRDCYQDLLATGMHVGGKLAATFTLDEQGHVSQLELVDNGLANPSFNQCLLAALRKPYVHGSKNGCASIKVPLRFVAQ